MALALAVCPLRRGDSSFYKNESALSKVFSQTDMVLSAAAYSYPCGDVLTFGVVIDSHVNCDKSSVCACDGLTVLADTTDCVSVNHIIWKFSDGWLVTSLPFICG